MSILDIPIFDGTIPEGENGHGCLVPTCPTPDTIVPRLVSWRLLSDEQIDHACRAFKDVMLERIAALRPIQIFQGDQGSCAASGGGNATSWKSIEENEVPEKPSQATVYAYDGVSGTGELIRRRADNGMALVSVIRVANLVGYASADVIPPMDWRQQHWPAGWQASAKQNRLLEWRRLDTLQAMKTAIATPAPILHGYNGHARVAVWRDPDNGEWYLPNSWVSQPLHKLTDRQMLQGMQQYEAFGLFSTTAR